MKEFPEVESEPWKTSGTSDRVLRQKMTWFDILARKIASSTVRSANSDNENQSGFERDATNIKSWCQDIYIQ